jgi:dephospho-CoA kinase
LTGSKGENRIGIKKRKGDDVTIFVIVGMPASGKNTGRIYAESKGFPYFATGDIVRAEARKRGLEENSENMATLSTSLRGVDGMGVTRLALASARDTGRDVVFLEGMRSWPEIELIRAEAYVVVVAFVAPQVIRRQRVVSRGRSDDSEAGFAHRDQREIDYGSAVPIALADEYVINSGSMAEAEGQLARVVEKYGRG